MKKEEISDYNSGWKEMIELYLPDFILFYYPSIYKDIDFERGFVFLDKELNKIVKDSVEKKRYVDKLVKVFLKNGAEKCILIHIEIQSDPEKGFPKRIYVYNYRISDRFDLEVVSLVILTDENENYRPNCYEIDRWGFKIHFEFPLVKLIDFKDKIDVEKATNPFEIITFAHLKNLMTKKDPVDRLFWKITLVKLLYKKGYKKEDILNIYRFLDWVMVLPENIASQFHDEIIKYEEEQKMPFITTAERIGIGKGKEIGIGKGKEIGREEEAKSLVVRQLNKKFKYLDEATTKQIEELALTEIEILSDDLLDMTALEDLEKWLNR